jgi:hypothetical protein
MGSFQSSACLAGSGPISVNHVIELVIPLQCFLKLSLKIPKNEKMSTRKERLTNRGSKQEHNVKYDTWSGNKPRNREGREENNKSTNKEHH